jgi:hypothetical protein
MNPKQNSKILTQSEIKDLKATMPIFNELMNLEFMKDNKELIKDCNTINEYLAFVDKQSETEKENARMFYSDKTSEQLREYLADKPIAYNRWKNANHDELIQLAIEATENT